MPHHFLGLGWDEIASIIGIFSVIFGGFIGWLVHTVNDNFAKNSKPLREAIDNLKTVLETFKLELEGHQRDIDKVSDKIDSIKENVVDHEARLKVLEKEDDKND